MGLVGPYVSVSGCVVGSDAPRIQVDGDTFALSNVAAPPAPLDDIEEVAFFKRDEFTTDLICCEIKLVPEKGGQIWFLHEEVLGWADLQALLQRLPGYRREWPEKVVLPPFAGNRTIAFSRPLS